LINFQKIKFFYLSKRRLKKRIRSLETQLKIHEKKIREEKTKPIPDPGLVNHWQNEIEIFRENIQKARNRLGKLP